jgi:TRAP-type uncharacterized transport system substrate-binding protein
MTLLRSRGWFVVGALLGVAAVLLAAALFVTVHVDLRIAPGPPGGFGDRFMAGIRPVVRTQQPRARIKVVPSASYDDAAKLLETGRVEAAILRSDADPPPNGRTVAVLRRDAAVFLLPAGTEGMSVPDVIAKGLVILKNATEGDNAELLNALLKAYGHPPPAKPIDALTPQAAAEALVNGTIGAVFAITPLTREPVGDIVSAVMKAGKPPPRVLGIDTAEALAQTNPALEPMKVPEGAFRLSPPVPEHAVETAGVTIRFVVADSMPDVEAAEILRALLVDKPRLVAATSLADGIAPPDILKSQQVLPVHPGVIAYLGAGDESFYERFDRMLYLGGLALSIAGTALAFGLGLWRRSHPPPEDRDLARIMAIAHAPPRDTAGLDGCGEEIRAIRERLLERRVKGKVDAERLATLQLALQHAADVLATERRRALLPSREKVAGRRPYG